MHMHIYTLRLSVSMRFAKKTILLYGFLTILSNNPLLLRQKEKHSFVFTVLVLFAKTVKRLGF